MPYLKVEVEFEIVCNLCKSDVSKDVTIKYYGGIPRIEVTPCEKCTEKEEE